MEPQRLLSGHGEPKELPSLAVLDPVCVRVRDDDQHRFPRADRALMALVLQATGARERALEDRERRATRWRPFHR